ncbi:GP16.7-like replication protein [Bacillus phage GA1]|uniref:16.7 protein homologue (Phi29) n=1 Tax=Bacillus phage GA-1 TaxID=2679898 RepID=Q9FZV5_BPGA1|nr:GP16.7-like replication protein [Bacillus phage GA1]CAC21541.1 16.7 protein homologue (phi29) [Bacillus phage GA1]
MTITLELWILGVAGIIILAIGWKIGVTLSDDTEEVDLTEDYQAIEDLKKQEQELLERIDHLQDKLYAREYGGTQVQHYKEALDEYEKSGIKIPLDIIEEITFIDNLRTKEEVMNYIENHRANWKLENSKKVGK